MSTFVDDGIVLRRTNYGEADRILTVLTREHGKLSVIARGVRKARAKMTGQTDLLSISRMQLATGRGERLVLTQAEAIMGPVESVDAVRTACAALIAEVADRVLESRAPDAEVFDLVAGTLQNIQRSANAQAEVIWCLRQLLDHLGYAPQLDLCLSCGAQPSDGPAWFSAAGGGLLCSNCAHSDLGAVECSRGVVKVLRCIQARDRDTYARLRWDAETLATLELVVELELSRHLDRRIRSLGVLRDLIAPVRAPPPASAS